MKFGMFFLAEYVNLWVASLVIVTLFLGGYLIPGEVYFAGWFYESGLGGLFAFLQVLMFLAKVTFIAICFIWVRWTLPRFKYNQLMSLGWSKLLPIALANLMVIALLITAWHAATH
jgi:NADH-quinone oxidoreductase subunit H